ncbi:CAP domain-containing protein [Sedimentibacter sp. B4]|uniref:CAP domain-containing protein n=1 Tax=Sedimentibacter sp. B4 TaxID=304766 RepID=UPI0002FD7DDE|nr:CAP domain-containing protein [Sedimentibacter sp. B4]
MKKVSAFALTLVLALTPVQALAFSNFNWNDFDPNNFNLDNFYNFNTTEPSANPTADPSVVPSSSSSYEKRVADLVNVERQKNGLPALSFNTKISDVARLKSKDMADNNYFAHQSPTYGMAGDMLLKYGVTYSAWGENIASGQDTPEEVVSQWMGSPSHRANILSPEFIYIGVGYWTDASGKTFWTQMFTGDDK